MEQLTLPSLLTFSLSPVSLLSGNEVFLYEVSPMEQLTLPPLLTSSLSTVSLLSGNEVFLY
jgi:hypothetical protein